MVVAFEFVNVIETEFLESSWDVDALEHLVLMLLSLQFLFCLRIQSLHNGSKCFLFLVIVNSGICDETKGILSSQNTFQSSGEKLLHDGTVTAQKVQSHWMIILNSLRNIDDPNFFLVV